MKNILIILTLLTGQLLQAQTGPGGVGNSSTNVLWLDAATSVFSDAGTTLALNNNNVQQWNDRSGNGRNASQGLLLNRPNYFTGVQNGMPVIRYTSANTDVLVSTGLTTGNTASVWAIASYSTLPSTNPGILQASPTGLSGSTGAADKVIGMWVNSGAGTRVWGRGVQSNNTQHNISQVTTLNASSFYILNSIYRSNRIDQYVNHNAAGNVPTHDGTLRSWTDVAIGRQGNESWNGDIAEIIMYNFEVNAAQRIIIDNYLSAKYGLALTLNDTYHQDNPGQGNYDHDVAGIGRVNAANIHADAQGSGIVRVLNPTGLNDNEFLIWGHNNAVPLAINTVDVPLGIAVRFDRVWRASERNATGVSAVDVGNIDMRWDLNGLGPVTVADLRLLIDDNDNGVFSDDTPIGGVIDLGGGIYEFQNVPGGAGGIQNNRRFTLGFVNANQTPLPVQLIYFKALNEDNRKVKLEWQTASEINNDYFTIENSVNGFDWGIIETIDGAGNSSTHLSYSVFDHNPHSGISYYRLKQTDFDGKVEYSPIVSVDLSHLNSEKIELYPNPTNNLITLSGSKNELSEILIFNSVGQDVTSLISINSTSESSALIDISQLANGIYYLRTKTMTNCVHKR